jgi:hypothetical protein
MHDGYRTATPADYAYITRLLTDGHEQGVLVRSLFRSDKVPYPLLDISQGPFQVTEEGVEGFSLEGQLFTLRITSTPLHNVELRRGEDEWIAPEMGSIILLIAC